MIEQQENIKKYLTDKMTAAEKQSFKNELANNSVLEKEVAFNEDLMSFLEDKNPELEAMLTQFGNEFSSKSAIPPPIIPPVITDVETPKSVKKNRNWLFLIIGILGALIAFWLISQAFSKEKTSSKTPIESNSILESAIPDEAIIAPKDIDKESNTSDTKIIKEEKKEEATEEAKENSTPIVPEIQDFTPKGSVPSRSIKKTEQPMASLDKADYSSNIELEALIRDGIRSNGLVFELNKSKRFPTFYQKEKQVKIIIDGTMNQDIPLELIIFDNVNENFISNRAVLKADFKVEPNGDDFLFSFTADTAIPKGLYYYFIYNKENQQALAISKFSVK